MGAFLHHQEVRQPKGKEGTRSSLRKHDATAAQELLDIVSQVLACTHYSPARSYTKITGMAAGGAAAAAAASAVRLCLAAWVWTPFAGTALAPSSTHSQAQGSANGHGCCGLGCQAPPLAPRAAAHHSPPPPPPPPPLRQGLCWCWMMVWREGKVTWRACGRRRRHRAPAPSRLHSGAPLVRIPTRSFRFFLVFKSFYPVLARFFSG